MTSPMYKSEWGPATWKTIHTIASAYPDEPADRHRRAMFSFLTSLPDLLPCGECGRHMRLMLEDGMGGLPPLNTQNDYRLSSRDEAFGYTVQMHNTVNKRLGKPVHSLDETNAYYSLTEGVSKAPMSPFERACLAVVVIGCVSCVAYAWRRRTDEKTSSVSNYF